VARIAAYGLLKKLTVRYPHRLGEIVAQYEVTARGLHAEIILPPGLYGSFEWQGQSHPLQGGKTNLELP
jgi:alpha-L-rhamnosidase